PAQPTAGSHYDPGGADRCGAALHAARRRARLRATPGHVLRVCRRGDDHLSRARRAGQTPTGAKAARPGDSGGATFELSRLAAMASSTPLTLERRSRRAGMSTYIEIRKFVQRHHGFVPKRGWIAHVKALRGLP